MEPSDTPGIFRARRTAVIIGCAAVLLALAIALYAGSRPPQPGAGGRQFVVALGESGSGAIAGLKSAGLVKSALAERIMLALHGSGAVKPGGYELSASMSAWQIARALQSPPSSVWAVIPEGLRKEQIAGILAKSLGWTAQQEQEWITVDTASSSDHIEGVYFPDTYLLPVNDEPAQTAKRLTDHFNEKFAPYAKEALAQNIKWTVGLTVASIIQREAAGKDDMPLISGIIWNRLAAHMPLGMDSTLQYARGDAGSGWWAPISVADKKIDSPYNTYMSKGLPPHPISDPGIEAIAAAFEPATTTCLYYLHDPSGMIHCSDTYEGHQQNIDRYLK